MLTHLTIRNFALVTELELQFESGLTVITGESGAGKSILLSALGLVLGERVQKSQIHQEASQCEVYAEFDLTGNSAAMEFLDSNELLDEAEPNTCLVRRTAAKSGRSRAWLNGNPVNLVSLRDFCGNQVGIHNQFEQRELMSTQIQLQWLDDYIADSKLVNTVSQTYRSWQELQTSLLERKTALVEANNRRELLEYQVDELDKFGIQENEFNQLSTRFKRLSKLQSILDSVRVIRSNLDEQGLPAVGRALVEIDRIEDSEDEIKASHELIESAQISLEEASHLVTRFVDKLTLDQESIEEVTSRLDAWHSLSRKHRVAATELQVQADSLREELKQIEQGDQLLEALERECREAENAYFRAAKQLSLTRKKASTLFARAVVDILGEIGMKDAEFQIEFTKSCSERGLEDINFLISANDQFAPAPLNKIASGGELSRISLAILVVVAARSNLPCLILDEADIGVGGTTADNVGRLLRRLSSHTQLLCVTHAPQVAALGNTHYQVIKSPREGVLVELLLNSDRIEELARMVGGHVVNAESRKYAAVLLKEAIETET